MASEIPERDHRPQLSIIFHKGENSSCELGKTSFKGKKEDKWNWEMMGRKQVNNCPKMCKTNARWTHNRGGRNQQSQHHIPPQKEALF